MSWTEETKYRVIVEMIETEIRYPSHYAANVAPEQEKKERVTKIYEQVIPAERFKFSNLLMVLNNITPTKEVQKASEAINKAIQEGLRAMNIKGGGDENGD